MEKWYQFFEKKQKSSERNHFTWIKKQGSFFGSGLDDYPRSDLLFNLDLQCWVVFFTQFMKELSQATGREEETKKYEQIENELKMAMVDFINPNEEDVTLTLASTEPLDNNATTPRTSSKDLNPSTS